MISLELYNYWVVIFLMMAGFYILIASDHLIKKVIGLNIFQTYEILVMDQNADHGTSSEGRVLEQKLPKADKQ